MDLFQGAPLGILPLGTPVGRATEHLTKPVRVVLAEESDRGEIIARATDLRGKVIRCRVPCTSLVDAAKARVGVILLMEEWEKK